MFNTRTLENGNLVITASNEGRAYLAERYRDPLACPDSIMAWLAVDWFELELVSESQYGRLGALTRPPILTDGGLDEEGDTDLSANFWWFPGYMLVDPMEQLKNTGRTWFQHADNA